MISDVLSDAVRNIEDYQREMPECYEAIRDKIEAVKKCMTELRQYLDAPPCLDAAATQPSAAMTQVFEQGALDSLHAARPAMDRAIAEYEQGRGQTLSLDSGPLFAALDNVDTVVDELREFTVIAKRV